MLRILELGCGKGRHADYLRKKYHAEVYGVDVTESSIELARAQYPQVKFYTMPAEKLEFEGNFFDAIYAYDVLEHVDDLAKAISEIARTIKSGGKLIVNLPHPKSEAWLGKIRPTYAAEMHHVRIMQDGELEKVLLPLGFELVKKRAEGFSDHVILYYLLSQNDVVADHQLGIGNWRDTWLGRIIFSLHAFSKPNLVFESWLKYVPIWLILIPVGFLINSLGNRYLPKSWYYEFRKY